MIGFNKKTCVRFNAITEDKYIVFALCEKLRSNSIHITDKQVDTPFCETHENSVEFLAYIVEKLLYCSHPDTKSINAYELVENYFDWFSYELSSYEVTKSNMEGLVAALNAEI